ncbi:hypothetical protein ATN38_00505 [Rhodococcus sp. FH8]|nr:hypothetical protein [Rhodococcus sp. FH8]
MTDSHPGVQVLLRDGRIRLKIIRRVINDGIQIFQRILAQYRCDSKGFECGTERETLVSSILDHPSRSRIGRIYTQAGIVFVFEISQEVGSILFACR